MTALEKFIKQIVLKQVKGSVYLVPAICDFQITEALEEEKKQGQTLPIHDVSDILNYKCCDQKKLNTITTTYRDCEGREQETDLTYCENCGYEKLS